MSIQRYVSPDLTHFVGRGKRNQKERYEVLRAILNSGRLRARKPTDLERAPYVLSINAEAKLSTNDAYAPSVVCFCDIPLGDLDIHMRKYSRFGIAFTKDFLLKAGATPVMYIPTKARPVLSPFKDFYRKPVASTARAFDEFYKRYHQLGSDFRGVEIAPGSSTEMKKLARQFRDLRYFLDINVLSHLKFFDPLRADSDQDNFYMEREWRVNGNVRFALGAVRRVIVPENFSRKFRNDFQKYDGEVMFVD
jgi:hypothetical protein